MSRTYEEFGELLSAYNEADEKWTPIQKAHELLHSVNEDEIWEQRNAATNALFKYIAELEAEQRWALEKNERKNEMGRWTSNFLKAKDGEAIVYRFNGVEVNPLHIVKILNDYESKVELEAEQRWIPVQDIMVGEIYLINGYDEWDSDRGTEVLDGFTIAKYYGIEDSCRVFADFYGTFLRFDMESDDLRNVYRLPE